MVSVNQISVDNKGEYIATCSDDGMVRVFFFLIFILPIIIYRQTRLKQIT